MSDIPKPNYNDSGIDVYMLRDVLLNDTSQNLPDQGKIFADWEAVAEALGRRVKFNNPEMTTSVYLGGLLDGSRQPDAIAIQELRNAILGQFKDPEDASSVLAKFDRAVARFTGATRPERLLALEALNEVADFRGTSPLLGDFKAAQGALALWAPGAYSPYKLSEHDGSDRIDLRRAALTVLAHDPAEPPLDADVDRLARFCLHRYYYDPALEERLTSDPALSAQLLSHLTKLDEAQAQHNNAVAEAKRVHEMTRQVLDAAAQEMHVRIGKISHSLYEPRAKLGRQALAIIIAREQGGPD